VLVRCVCSHAYQEKRYTNGFRVGNPITKTQEMRSPDDVARCTVCGRLAPIWRKKAKKR
jgi:hypothetical protein